jgi:hypothetical protein
LLRSSLMFANGSTATDGLSGKSTVVRACRVSPHPA